MRRRLRTALAALAGLVGLAGPGAGAVAAQEAAVPLDVAAVDVTAFPEVSVTVSAPGPLVGRSLPPEAFSVREGGERREVQVTGLPTDALQVVLVIDASGSMAGAPLEAAKAAAGAFLATVRPGTQVAAVGFGNEPFVVSPFTADPSALSAALVGIQARGETALYDALTVAARQFPADAPARRSVVLVSDGGDTRSTGTLEAAAAALQDAGAGLTAVVLATAESDPAALERLAGATGGTVVAGTDPAALAGVYEAIASQLANQYRLTFRSEVGGSTELRVAVSHDGVTAEATRAVALPEAPEAPAVAEAPPASAPPATVPAGPRVVSTEGVTHQGWFLAAGIAAFAVALAVGGLLLFLRPERASQLSVRRSHHDTTVQALSGLADRATALAERSLARSHRRHALNTALEQAGLALRPGELVVLVGTVAFSAGALGLLLLGPLGALAAAAAVVLAVRLLVVRRRTRRRAAFAEQLEETLPLMAGTLRAGFGLLQAVDAVARELDSPTAEEFQRVVTEVRLGRDVSDAFHALAGRVGNEDFDWVVEAIDIHRQVGGDLAELLDNVAGTIRDRNRIRRQIDALSGEGRLSAAILFVLPFLMAAFVAWRNPDYLGELTGSGLGQALLVAAGALMVFGGLWMRRIIRLVF